MRVLVNTGEDETGVFEVCEVSFVISCGYDSTGLLIIPQRGEPFFLLGITKFECNAICEELLKTGFYDLTKYGIIQDNI